MRLACLLHMQSFLLYQNEDCHIQDRHFSVQICELPIEHADAVHIHELSVRETEAERAQGEALAFEVEILDVVHRGVPRHQRFFVL